MGKIPFEETVIELEPIRKVKAIITDVSKKLGIDPIDLAQGNPIGVIPQQFAEIFSDLLLAQSRESLSSCGYCPSSGLPEYLERMARYERETFGLNVTADHILAVPGAAAGLGVIFSALAIEQKGNVVIPSPFFPAYREFIENVGLEARVTKYRCSEEEVLREIRDEITPDTLAVLINSPNNPSGRIFSSEFLKGLSWLLVQESSKRIGKQDIVLISDQPYRRLIQSQVEVPVVANVVEYPYVIEGDSFSKEARLAGYRIGYVTVGPKFPNPRRIRDLLASRLIPLSIIQSSTPIQWALARCDLPFNLDWSENFSAMNSFASQLEDIGYGVIRPDGGLFMCVKVKGVKSDVLHENLIKLAVGNADGQYFGMSPEDGFVRLSFFDAKVANHPDAINRFRTVYSSLN